MKLRSLLGTMLTRIGNMRIEAMSERKLEPTPGWCERAYELLRDVQFYRYLPNEHDALMKRGSELMRQSDKAGVSDNEWRAAALDKMNARFKRYVENELKPESPPQNDVSYDGYCVSCHGFYVASTGGGTCPVCEARVRPGLKIASDTLLLKDLPMPMDHEIISLWEKQIAEENQRSRDAGEQHPNIGEEFIQAVELARKYYNKAAQKPAPLPHEVADNIMHGHFCQHCGEYFESIHRRNPCPARNEPPAEKAEALPELPEHIELWLHQTTTGERATREAKLARLILAEVDKRIDRRGDAIGDRVAGLLLSNADAMGLIARDEISKAVVHAFNANVDDFVPRPDLYRIVPGKEGE